MKNKLKTFGDIFFITKINLDLLLIKYFHLIFIFKH